VGNPFTYLWRHPRRTGFVAFNLIVLSLFALWGLFTSSAVEDGIGGIPNVMLGMTGMGLLVLVWVAGWIAWGTMLASHPRNRA
jgi:protein-S-isoprenylcysteine O-methyltransferase Ste14